VVEFSLECIVAEVFPELIDRYFTVLGEDEYLLAVWSRSAPRRMIYRSDTSVTLDDSVSADATADLFGLRPDRLPAADVASTGLREQREPYFDVPHLTGRWQQSVEHRLGYLDVAIDRLRFRNLATSLGILLVLVGGVAMIVAASERARVLANHQIRFAAGVSHELHTPLAAIQALAHNLKTGVVREPAQIEQYARMMLDETRGLSGMVDQVLLFAETQSKVKRYDVEPVEVTEALNRALAGLASQIRESRCQVVTEVPDDVPLLRSNIHALTHCIRNLVNNALKHGKSWSPGTIHIKVRPSPRDREVQIQVIDSGPGIDSEDLPHIFEAFYRGEKAGSETRGTGLGLYLVKHLMEAQGGTVTVETKFGAGSTFTLHAPVFPPPELTR
jgi:signal transduction histidine kinase